MGDAGPPAERQGTPTELVRPARRHGMKGARRAEENQRGAPSGLPMPSWVGRGGERWRVGKENRVLGIRDDYLGRFGVCRDLLRLFFEVALLRLHISHAWNV